MLTIGKIAKASGCKVQTIRYYEQIGLIAAASRTEGNQRLYRQADVDRLQFIRHARSLGFSTDTIKDLLTLENHSEMSCAAVDNIAREQLALVQGRIKQLQSLAKELESMISQCAHEDIAHCKILQALHEHDHCDDHKPLDV
ncbi:MerR family transcriptional regulator [Salinibius halmophilus]|uniref:MerR family transcriptional regulator n=1 Tax=Salinibius halmophilus TaxID=1853216 RepID=UPI000E6615BA|nr:helix-turn-helix domain-containing protein [Salinibius halmophilus]